MLSRLVNILKINKQLIILLIDPVLLISILLASFLIHIGHWYHSVEDEKSSMLNLLILK